MSGIPVTLQNIARLIGEADYITVGDVLGQLQRNELTELVTYANAITLRIDPPEYMTWLTLLADMLTEAEGGDTTESMVVRVSNLIILITFEDLARKKFIDFDRTLATLSGDLQDIPNLAKIR